MHPGELLREEILPALDRPKTEIDQTARCLASDALRHHRGKAADDSGHGVAARQAVRQRAHLWLNLQKRYDLHRARQEMGEKIKAIPTLEVA
jgi:plasmid maintenance system antidote protein VapI